MMDAVNGEEVVRNGDRPKPATISAARMRVIHRVDIHATVWGSRADPSRCGPPTTQVVDIRQTADDVTVL